MIAVALGREEARPGPGTLRRIVYDRISGEDNGARGSYFMGLPERHIEDVALRDVALQVGATDKTVPAQQSIAEMRDAYPDAHMVPDAVPAYGLWARHIDGLTLVRVRVLGSRQGSATDAASQTLMFETSVPASR